MTENWTQKPTPHPCWGRWALRPLLLLLLYPAAASVQRSAAFSVHSVQRSAAFSLDTAQRSASVQEPAFSSVQRSAAFSVQPAFSVQRSAAFSVQLYPAFSSVQESSVQLYPAFTVSSVRLYPANLAPDPSQTPQTTKSHRVPRARLHYQRLTPTLLRLISC